ncbi:MAG: anthranilate synthase component I family protein [Kiritimatiellae bacterium]|nr:anthranilate synthase component I family protein [Kiritimatiellia bacterium]
MLKTLAEEEFLKRTRGGARTPVFKEFLADRETPVSVLTRIAESDDSVFLLESVEGGETRGRYSYLGFSPVSVVTENSGEDPLPALREAVNRTPFTPAPELPSLQGGAIGYVAYDAVKAFVPRTGLAREEGTPTADFLVTDTFAVFDNVRDTITVAKVASFDDGYEKTLKEIDALAERLISAESIARYVASHKESGGHRLTPFVPEMEREEFVSIVEKCKAAIRAGEVIQIVPSQKFTAETDIPAISLYRALRIVNPSPYNFFLKLGGKTLIGSSPEELVKLEKGVASTCPIAGTKPRGKTPEEDAELEMTLRLDPKERAEHVMLVDLGRNDLGRVSKIGSVKVGRYAEVERYSHVMHLVSTVTGELDAGKDAFDLLKATFPAGTLSGAPKVRAMELLAGLEKSPRGIYGGAAGYFSYTGDMNFAIVIRTMVLDGGRLTMRAGAGIVADSDPEREYEETVNKSKAIFEAAKFAATL